MSDKVDQRVVQMRFDNQQFEQGIQTSTKSLENLKKGLKLDDAAKSLSNLDKAGRSFSLAGIATGVDTIASKFTTLGIMGVTVLANITNSAINAGKRITSALTIDPIKAGLDMYETKINAIQTILTNTASKGTTLQDVNKALAELNEYSNQTIYSFADMTRNIGTFTAAGVDLNTSVTAIKGIANLAAGSGSSAQQAATAMYQLSQALATGTVKLMDWNSVVNAGMGGELFQKALEKTAKELGKGRDMSVSFRDSLQDGWLTTAVLTKTLEKFANDKSLIQAATQVKTFTQLFDTMKESVASGWAVSWENIIGNKDEAAATLTALNDAFSSMTGKSADARNAMLSFWKANGGRDMLIEGITNAFKGLQAILKPIGEAFRDVFPAMTGQRLVDITKAFRDLTAKFKIGAETASNIKITFKGLFSIVDIGVKAFELLAKGVGLLIQALIPGTGSLLSITASIGKFAIQLNDSIDKNKLMNISLEKMSAAFAIVKQTISGLLSSIGPLLTNVKNLLLGFGDSFKTLFQGTTAFAATLSTTNEAISTTESGTNKLKTALDKVGNVFVVIRNVIVSVAKTIKSILTPIFDSIKKKFDSFSMQDIGSLLTGAGLLMFARTLSKGLSSVDDILDNFSNILEQVGNSLKAFQLKVKAEALLKIAIALGILAAALVVLSFIKIADLAKSLGALTIMLTGLIIAIKVLGKQTNSVKNIFGQIGQSVQLVGFATGILILAGALKILSSIDTGKLIQSTVALGAIMAMLVTFTKLTQGGTISGLISFAVGITILSGALFILGSIDTGKLIQGVTAIAALMGVITVFIKLTQGGGLAKSAGGLTAFAIGITILSGALAILGNMKVASIIQGTLAITTLMTVIGAFINLTNGSDLKTSAGGLTAFAIGITILTGSLAILGNMKVGNLIQGTVAIGSLMAIIAAFINLTNGGDLKSSASGLIGFSVGITILTGALAILAGLDTGKLIQGVLAIQSLITVIGVFIKVTSSGDLNKSASGLIGFSVGLTVLSGAVSILASINPDRVVQGVTAIVALMTAIGAFINLTKGGDLQKTAKGLIGFSTGLMVLAGVIAILSALNPEKLLMASVAISTLMAAIGVFVNLTNQGDLTKSAVGLIAFSVGIGALSASLVIIAQLDTGKIIAAGGAISALLLVIMAFVKLTSAGDLVISAAGLVIFSGAIMVLTQAITTLGSYDIKTLLVGIGALAAVFIVIGLTSAVLAPLTPVILGLSAAIALFGAGCLEIGVGMLAFASGMDILSKSGVAGAQALAIAVTNIIQLIPLALTTLAQGIIGFAKTIGDGAPVIANATLQVLESFIQMIVSAVPMVIEAGIKLVLGFLTAVNNNMPKLVVTGISIVLNFIKGVISKLPDIIDTAFKVIIAFINGLADAITNNHQALYSAIGNLIMSIVNAVKDLMPTIVNIGVNIINGFISGIKSMANSLLQAALNVVRNAVDAVKDFLGIHSPSRVFGEIGEYSALGFAEGLNNFADRVSKSATNVGVQAVNSIKGAISKISDVVNGNIDANPTIRPVLDLSSIVDDSKRINDIIGQNGRINVSSIGAKVPVISKTGTMDSDNTQVVTPQQGSTISFVQNNYSPKALSRLDIYRQTKNQISTMKGLVNPV